MQCLQEENNLKICLEKERERGEGRHGLLNDGFRMYFILLFYKNGLFFNLPKS